MFNYGSVYKRLRKEQGITQTQAANGICSISKLSRWENNQVEVEFSTALALLKKINITPTEFSNWAHLEAEYHLPEKIERAIINEDMPKMRSFALRQIKDYHESKNIFTLTNAIIVFNQLFLLTGKDYLSTADKHRIVFYLTHNVVWSQYNIILFVNSAFLLDAKTTCHIALKLIHNYVQIEQAQSEDNLETFFGGLSDTIIAMICKKKLGYAEILLKELRKIELPFYHLFFQLTLTFLQKIIAYCRNQDEAPVLTIINNLVAMNCRQQAEKYLDIFKTVKDCWSKKA